MNDDPRGGPGPAVPADPGAVPPPGDPRADPPPTRVLDLGALAFLLGLLVLAMLLMVTMVRR